MVAPEHLNILVTLNERYLPYLNVMLASLIHHNAECQLDVYLLHSSIPDSALATTERLLCRRGQLIPIRVSALTLDSAPTTGRYPYEIYYRLFAARLLPETLDRVLYLDPDLVVNGSLLSLYHLPMQDDYFAAASHTGPVLNLVNTVRLGMEKGSPYINSGVMLMNLSLLRAQQREEDVFSFIESRKKRLILPDQDIISGLYGRQIVTLDTFRYNMTERLYWLHKPFHRELTLDWVRKNAVIIHYCGRNKPWKSVYVGQLNRFYHEAEAMLREMTR